MSAAAIRAKKFAGTPMEGLFIVEDVAPVEVSVAEEARGFRAPGDKEFTYFDFC